MSDRLEFVKEVHEQVASVNLLADSWWGQPKSHVIQMDNLHYIRKHITHIASIYAIHSTKSALQLLI